MERKNLLAQLRRVHAEVDRVADGIAQRLGEQLKCGPGCNLCCQDDLTVFEIEALRIRDEFPELLRTKTPGPTGQCAFLDEAGRCRAYAARPYVCRTQGLPLRWLVFDSGDWTEFRDVCEVNDDDFPLETLAERDCFTLGPIEELLRELQAALASGQMTRVKLRDLFGE